MPKPITKNQMRDFWFDEFQAGGWCHLCGNHGVIDTRKGKVIDPRGVPLYGARFFCICPNGRVMKSKGVDLDKVKASGE